MLDWKRLWRQSYALVKFHVHLIKLMLIFLSSCLGLQLLCWYWHIFLKFCLKLALLASLPTSHGGLGGRVIYIDVESKFSSRRIIEMGLNSFPEIFNMEGMAQQEEFWFCSQHHYLNSPKACRN